MKNFFTGKQAKRNIILALLFLFGSGYFAYAYFSKKKYNDL